MSSVELTNLPDLEKARGPRQLTQSSQLSSQYEIEGIQSSYYPSTVVNTSGSSGTRNCDRNLVSSSNEEPAEGWTTGIEQESLPPVDNGWGAWSSLAAAFLVEALCWGFPFSWGIFQSYYSNNPPFSGSTSISVVGTLATGIPYLAGPIVFPLVARYPGQRKTMMWSGLVLVVIACMGSSFATEIWQLILTQGILFGCGVLLLYTPCFSLMNEWFVKKRGLAFGIMFGGTGLSGLVLPLLFEKLLTQYGHATTMRAWGLAMLTLATPALGFLKGRLPASQVTASRRVDLSFLKNKFFYGFALSNLLQGLGFFLPSIYLPSFASDLEFTAIQSTLVLSFFNISTVFGQLLLGYISDMLDVHIPLFLSTFVSSLCVYLLWGFSKSFTTLSVFSIFYGLSAGGYSVLYSRFATKIAGEDSGVTMTLMGVFGFERGLGNILSGPISGALLGGRGVGTGEYAVGRYKGIVMFVGAVLAGSSLGLGGKLL